MCLRAQMRVCVYSMQPFAYTCIAVSLPVLAGNNSTSVGSKPGGVIAMLSSKKAVKSAKFLSSGLFSGKVRGQPCGSIHFAGVGTHTRTRIRTCTRERCPCTYSVHTHACTHDTHGTHDTHVPHTHTHTIATRFCRNSVCVCVCVCVGGGDESRNCSKFALPTPPLNAFRILPLQASTSSRGQGADVNAGYVANQYLERQMDQAQNMLKNKHRSGGSMGFSC